MRYSVHLWLHSLLINMLIVNLAYAADPAQLPDRIGSHTCGIPIGVKGIPLALQATGPAYRAALVAMRDDIRKDAEFLRGMPATGNGAPAMKPEIKAAIVMTPRGPLLLVRGSDMYFCGVAMCSFDAFTEVNGQWVRWPSISFDLGDDVYLYQLGNGFPTLSWASVISEDSVVLKVNPRLGRYEECSTETRIPMKFSPDGHFVVPVRINDTITLDFAIDSGADDVVIPADVVLTLIRAGTIGKADFNGSAVYTLADGSQVPSERFIIRTLKIGMVVIHNVQASVAPPEGGLLLGQSFLRRFQSWSIDNSSDELVVH